MARLFFLLLWLLPVGAMAQPPTPALLRRLDSSLTYLHERAQFNGVVLVARNGRITYSRALGVANPATNEPLHLTSAFNLASVSKQFMAMLIMQLQERGKLRYDDPVRTYLPDFPYDSITVRHLLTHTSGLPEYFALAERYAGPLDTLTNADVGRLLRTYKPPLRFRPGDRWEYCNTGYVLLGSLIEQVTGMPVAQVFERQIARPLGLKNTTVYHLKAGLPSPANRVWGFRRENGRNLPDDLIPLDGVVGDGNVYASAEDLLRWDQALYTDKLVRRSTLADAFKPVRLNRRGSDSAATYPYGFGWALDTKSGNMWHTGSWAGFYTLIVRQPTERQTLIVLTSNHDQTARRVAQTLLNKQPVTLPRTELIRNVRLVDGTGTPARSASVRLRDQSIWEVGDLEPFPNEPVTDGRGQVLAPGFIDSHSHHDWGLADQPEALAVVSQGVTTIVVGQDGGSRSVDTLAQSLNRRPVAVNVATYTGQATLRQRVMGPRGLYRTATPDELIRMKTLLASEMQRGSLGLSTGLEYESSFFSSRDEVRQLAQVAADSGGRYISHIRSEDINLSSALDEIIEIGRLTKMPVQIAHIKIALRDQWGQAPAVLARLEAARDEGINITADCYPYDYWMSTLRVLFPKRDYANPASAEFAVRQLFDPAQSVLVSFGANPAYVGQTVSAIARQRNRSDAQTLMALIAEAAAYAETNGESGQTIMGKSMNDADVARLLAWPHTNICSDGTSAANQHPRGYGSFPRVLARHVREQKLLSLETAVYKMTGLTAQHLGLTNRGLIAPGYAADLVLFDPDTVQDNARIGQSQALTTGIEQVWVNGQSVYGGQQATRQYPGVLIRRSR